MAHDRSTSEPRDNPGGSPYAAIDTVLGVVVVAALLVAAWACWQWASALVGW